MASLPGRGDRSSASLGDDIDPSLMIDKAWTSFVCNHLSGDSMKDEFSGDSMKDEFSGDSMKDGSVGDSTGI